MRMKHQPRVADLNRWAKKMSLFDRFFGKKPQPATFEALWSKLVPESGQAPTVQGELVRAIGRMSDDFGRNGYANWDSGYEIFSALLAARLSDGTFGPQTTEGVKKDIEMIAKYARGEKVTYDLEEAHQRLEQAVVAWCAKHPAPISHPVNPNLER